jgi:hypothetical protein
MAISRAMMRRQLRSQGGIMQLADRDQYFLGGVVKSVKKAVSGAVDTVTDFAKSDVGKMALMAAGAYYAPALFGGTVGFGPTSTYGSFAKGLMSPNFIGPMTKAGSLGRTISSGITGALTGGSLKTGAAILGGSALMSSLFGSPEQAKQLYSERPSVVREYLAQYYRNINSDREDLTDEEVEQFVNEQTREYAANGGRIGFEEGGTFLTMEEAAKRDPAMFMDTTTYNPIPADADRQAAAEIARTMMAVRSLPREDGEIEDTETMSTKDFMINEYFKPKRKELMENFGLSLEEANNLIKEAVAQIRDKKADGGMPTGIMRLNQAGVKERDYREDGGFVPVGIKEKADDVPAMLSKNEFVMTADAVRGAGNGDVEKGAQRMYKVMKTLENGGRI